MKQRLLKQGERFSFFQAYRLLRLLAQQEGHAQPELKVRPNITLNFPFSTNPPRPEHRL